MKPQVIKAYVFESDWRKQDVIPILWSRQRYDYTAKGIKLRRPVAVIEWEEYLRLTKKNPT
jgi:hypothetical protein